jgi:hypothetical protein
MPSSPTSSLRLEKQADGENTNLWGDKLDQTLDKIDAAVAGWLTKPLSGDYALTTANYAADEASVAMLKFTGTGAFTVTVPAVSKAYRIWNACSGVLTVTNGSSRTTLQPGEVVDVVTDGAANFARVQPTDFGGQRITGVGAAVNAGDAVNYSQMNTAVSTAAFSMGKFGVPVVPGDSGRFLTNDGASPMWGYAVTQGVGLATVAEGVVTVADAQAADVLAGTTTTKAMTPGDTYNAFAEAQLYTNSSNQLVTGGAAGTLLDMSTFLNAEVTLAANVSLPNPINPKVGQTGWIRLTQDAAGGRTMAYGSNWKRQGGPGALSTAANATDILVYEVITPTFVLYDIKANPS